MLDGTLRVRFKDRDLAFTPFKTLPVPPPVEDDKTLDAPLDAVIARNAPSATGSSRKGVDNGLARYGAVGGALRQAIIHPHSTHPLSTWPEKGTFLLCLDRQISIGNFRRRSGRARRQFESKNGGAPVRPG